VGSSATVRPGIAFEEVTGAVGMARVSLSYGAAWGDLDRDGWPDLFVGHHGDQTSLYWNDGDGRFSDVGDVLIPDGTGMDWHGTSWADFDNDGDQDVIVIAGAADEAVPSANRLFVNDGAVFVERGAVLGIDYKLGRGRNPLWWDWNGDGRLDLVVTNTSRSDGFAPSTVFEQTDTGFIDVNALPIEESTRDIHFAQLGDLSGDGVPELMTGGGWPVSYRILDTATAPFTDVTDLLGLGTVRQTADAAIADFTGDQLPDLFLLRRSASKVSNVVQSSSDTLKVHLRSTGSETGFDFATLGFVTFDTSGWLIQRSEIFIGATGWNPSTSTFILSEQSRNTHGLAPHLAGTDSGLYIGYDPVSERWSVRTSNRQLFEAIIRSSTGITQVSRLGPSPQPNTAEDRFYMQMPGRLTNVTAGSGLETPTECSSIAAGDFDNDMDVDLYMVCSGPVVNKPNLLFENEGDGTFLAVPNAGGAAGSSDGRGDSVAMADYDRDGFLDLFVTNGAGAPPLGEGPHQLFRNLGNGNHWIEIDLEGVTSNRNGIGARVTATAGGLRQLREQAGGMHSRSQNHMRLHFGLGDNTYVDELVVEWPSGIVQEIGPVLADQVLHITEPELASAP
jgi:hypothetical protein